MSATQIITDEAARLQSDVRERAADLRRDAFPPDHVQELWNLVPEHLQEPLLGYMRYHFDVGAFLKSILSNDLQGAVIRADPASLRALTDIVKYLIASAPAPCWGSKARVNEWLSAESRDRARRRDEIRKGLRRS